MFLKYFIKKIRVVVSPGLATADKVHIQFG